MRLTLGSPAPDFSAESIGGRGVSLEQLRGRPLLLKFYRFATCPVCNVHMHRFIMEHRMVSDAGLTTIVFYHSPRGQARGRSGLRHSVRPHPRSGQENLPRVRRRARAAGSRLADGQGVAFRAGQGADT